MAVQLQPLKELDAREQAIYFHSRQRRRSLAGIPEMHRTHQIFGGTTMPVASFDPSVIFAGRELSPITLKTAIRIADNTNARSGMILDISDASGGLTITLSDTTLVLIAGGVGTDRATVIFDNTIQWPAGLELDLVASVKPGTGQARLWANGLEVARGVAGDGDLGSVGWSSGNNGSFASAANGATPVGVTPVTAPVEFAVIEPLSIYLGQSPRQFLSA